MHRRLIPLAFCLSSCSEYAVKVPSAGLERSVVEPLDDVESDEEEEEEEEEEDWSMYEGAVIRIVEPDSGAFLPWNEENDFVAVIQTPDGE